MPGQARRPGGSDSRADADIALVGRARQGDPRAFAELMGRHQSRIYGLIMRIVGDRASAEELTQDTFLRVWKNLEGFRGDANAATWLYSIAVNLCRDHLGGRQVRQRRCEVGLCDSDMGPAAQSLPGPPGPDRQLEEKEVALAFRRALEELDPDHRAAFLLRHQEGLSPAEIAQALGISESNAKVRVHRARRRILATLRQLGHEV